MEKPARINFTVKEVDWEILQEILRANPHFDFTTAIREALQAWRKLKEKKNESSIHD